MGYTGDVTVAGPSDLRVLDEVEVRKLAVGPSENNAYLLTCRRSGAQLLVDAADESRACPIRSARRSSPTPRRGCSRCSPMRMRS